MSATRSCSTATAAENTRSTERFSDEFFNTQGDLMEAMSRVAEMRGETGRLCRELREGFDEAREALREKLEKEW